MELDIIVERSAYFPDSIRKDKLCDYYQEFHKEGKLLVSFTNVLVRMYVNYVLNCLLELDLTLREERILLDWVYTFPSDLMYEFLRASYLFFNEPLNLCCSKYFNIGGCCYGFSRQKQHYGPYE